MNGGNIYPNPNNGNFILNIQGYSDNKIFVSINNALGENIYLKELEIDADNYLIPLTFNNISAGIYFISLFSENNTATYSIIVE